MGLHYVTKYFTEYLQKNPRFQWKATFFKKIIQGAYLHSYPTRSEDKTEKFIFIVGCGRSGNTLLRRLLMERYDIFIPPETYVLPNQVIRYAQCAKGAWSEKVDSVLSALEYHSEFSTFGVPSLSPFAQEAKRWKAGKKNFYVLIDGLYRWLGGQSRVNTAWIGDKTPLNTLNLGILRKGFPKSKFVYIERDPVDVVYSYLDSGIYTEAKKASERWVKSAVAWSNFRRLHGEENCLEIKYEDLVQEPSAKIALIAETFGIPEIPTNRSVRSSDLGDVEIYSHHANVVKPPSMDSIGKGRRQASDSILKEIGSVVGKFSEKRGYLKIS
jgi:hypothetical protein